MHKVNERYIHYNGYTLSEEMGELGTGEDYIEMDLKLDVKIWTGFSWPRLESSGRLVSMVMNDYQLIKDSDAWSLPHLFVVSFFICLSPSIS